VELVNDSLALVVVPELGGKVASLVSRATGREWLWRNPDLPYRRARPGDSYVALHDTGGIDECLPTVAPSLGFPDHGELWAQPWEVEERGDERLALRATGVRAAYRLRRGLELAGARVVLDYQLENLSARELAFVWCLHPLLAIEPGMTIELPEATPIRVPDPHGRDFRASATKRFAGPLARGDLALRTADGREALRLAFDPSRVPFVGLWQNYRGWSGAGGEPYFNLGLEPSIGDSDGLEDAMRRGTAARLAPGGRREWRIALELAP
jgi:hypothetical protein